MPSDCEAPLTCVDNQCLTCTSQTAAQESHTDVKATHEDAVHWYQTEVRDGWAPLRLFDGTNLQPGQRVVLTSVAGVSIARIYPNGTNQHVPPQPCPEAWLLHFRRGDGTLVQGVPSALADYVNGVAVPEADLEALIGFSDVSYFDNEGNRYTTANDSTDGCDFTFELQVDVCQ
ncbi:MAG: hypothetical protein AB2A00_27080 [Myxococcota bacterium]